VGPAGRLEALLKCGCGKCDACGGGFAIRIRWFGGTLHNKVVFHTMKALNSFGFPVLRFNFRGAGLSHGEHDHGNGEVEDVRTALKLAGCGVSSALDICGIFFWRGGGIAGCIAGCTGESADRRGGRQFLWRPT